MSLSILTNVSSMAAQRSVAESARMMDTAMERLSSGKRINSAGDDAAGLATAMRMEAQVRGLDMAAKNVVDGQALVQTIESSLEEVEGMLQRMRELAVQAANGALSVTDRLYIEGEKDALVAEIDRMQLDGAFNGVKLFDGNFSSTLQVGADKGDTISVNQSSIASSSLGGNIVATGPIAYQAAATSAVTNSNATGNDITVTNTVTGQAITTASGAADSAKQAAARVNAGTSTTNVSAVASTKFIASTTNGATQITLTITGGAGSASTGTISTAANTYSALVNAINGISGSTGVTAELAQAGTGFFLVEADGDDIKLEMTETNTFELDITGVEDDDTADTAAGSTITLTNDTTTDHATLRGRISFHSSDTFTVADAAGDTNGYVGASTQTSTADTIDGIDLTTVTGAGLALAKLDGAIESVASMRADLGAIDNRLTHVHRNLLVSSEQTSAAVSKVVDADYAAESANLAKAQVLQQAATAMLAQANAQPQMVLQLIQ
jgi:flagellin